MEVILRILFFFFSNADIKFAELEKLTWKAYTVAKALLTTNRVKFINKREFARVALNENFETFVIYVAILEVPIAMSIHALKTSQVQRLNEFTLATL